MQGRRGRVQGLGRVKEGRGGVYEGWVECTRAQVKCTREQVVYKGAGVLAQVNGTRIRGRR